MVSCRELGVTAPAHQDGERRTGSPLVQEAAMFWCLLAPAALLAALGLASLTLDVRKVHLPRLSPRRALRGCLAGGLFLVAGLLVALAVVVQPWLP
jgi:hypothetical protein